MVSSNISNKGYILLDILIGLAIFSLGFGVVLGMTQAAAMAKVKADNYLSAVNLASSTMDEVISNLKNNNNSKNLSSLQDVNDKVGFFERTIRFKLDSPSLILITVKIDWVEKGEIREYFLESMYHAQE